MQDSIVAVRGTQRKEFSITAWDTLPADKCGWTVETQKALSDEDNQNSTPTNWRGKGGDRSGVETTRGHGENEKLANIGKHINTDTQTQG